MPTRPLSPELQEKAIKELNEDPKRLESDIRHMKEWISKQSHLKARTEDQWIVSFLRGCKFSLEKAKQKIDLYYTLYNSSPEFNSVRHNSPKFNEILDTGCLLILPKPSAPDAPKVVIIRPGAFDANKVHISECMAVLNVLQEIHLLDDDNASVAGVVVVLDLDAVTINHFFQMTPMQMKRMVVASQDASPLRLRGQHYLNTPPGFETIFNAINSLLSDKNRSRSFVHNKNYEEFYKHIPKNILPEEYGGTAGTVADNIDYWKSKVKEYKTVLEESLQCGADEARRPEKSKPAADDFGVEGSFRKLNVD
ncbi:unnamed protein product [Plutella xylostella]|uniref:(diamondback moth) hypothetical protein n=1 Tax=Plutella xylostella TaxID=51655 RepID=A0A8S4DIF9_PLUXY|nr:unnamed protein product [Plutella xylostella]